MQQDRAGSRARDDGHVAGRRADVKWRSVSSAWMRDTRMRVGRAVGDGLVTFFSTFQVDWDAEMTSSVRLPFRHPRIECAGKDSNLQVPGLVVAPPAPGRRAADARGCLTGTADRLESLASRAHRRRMLARQSAVEVG